MNVRCPRCDTVYRVDPARVPDAGVLTRCSACQETFRVEAAAGVASDGGRQVGAGPAAAESTAGAGAQPAATEPTPPADARTESPAETGGGQAPPVETSQAPATATPQAPATGTPEGPGPERPAFGPQDPHMRAKRIARALVSDITVYHPERVEKSRAEGTLRKDFRDEILKSWDEYVEQVGEEMARGTTYFREALNKILAEGEKVF